MASLHQGADAGLCVKMAFEWWVIDRSGQTNGSVHRQVRKKPTHNELQSLSVPLLYLRGQYIFCFVCSYKIFICLSSSFGRHSQRNRNSTKVKYLFFYTCLTWPCPSFFCVVGFHFKLIFASLVWVTNKTPRSFFLKAAEVSIKGISTCFSCWVSSRQSDCPAAAASAASEVKNQLSESKEEDIFRTSYAMEVNFVYNY